MIIEIYLFSFFFLLCATTSGIGGPSQLKPFGKFCLTVWPNLPMVSISSGSFFGRTVTIIWKHGACSENLNNRSETSNYMPCSSVTSNDLFEALSHA